MFPEATDYHKLDKRKVPNGLGVLYVLCSATYLFLLHFFHIKGALTLAAPILFGGFLGLFDDWVDLRWRYKAFTPILASLPLIALREGETVMATYIWGKVDFGVFYYILIVPLIVTVTTNAINMLGGLNGLETICPLIVMIGLAAASRQGMLLIVPILIYLALAYLNVKGKIFVGNVGTFAVGITLASYSIVANNEQTLFISIAPYIFNSILILLTHFLKGEVAQLSLTPKEKLTAGKRRSLQTLIAYKRELTEHQLVAIISLLVFCSTCLAVLLWWLYT